MINPEDIFSKEQLEFSKALGQFARSVLGNSFMTDGELTKEERESEIPIKQSKYGYYRMYRWECGICKTHGKKMPYSRAIEDGYRHFILLKHRKNTIIIVGGVFPKTELYKE